MAYPEEPGAYIVVLIRERDGGPIQVYIERSALDGMEEEASEMYFVLDISRRYKLRFDRPIRELLRSETIVIIPPQTNSL